MLACIERALPILSRVDAEAGLGLGGEPRHTVDEMWAALLDPTELDRLAAHSSTWIDRLDRSMPPPEDIDHDWAILADTVMGMILIAMGALPAATEEDALHVHSSIFNLVIQQVADSTDPDSWGPREIDAAYGHPFAVRERERQLADIQTLRTRSLPEAIEALHQSLDGS